VSSCFAERQLGSVDPGRMVRIAPAPVERGEPLSKLCREALARPLASAPLGDRAARARSVAVIVSDATRDEPREALLDAVFEHVPRDRAALIVASGTHAADASVIPPRYADLQTLVHDAGATDRLVDLGHTRRGTPVRLLAEVARADLVVLTGRVRPHYFAGFSGGTKGVFPGVADRQGALANHRLKADPSARLGRVDDNVCRLDMEEAALRLEERLFALNVLSDVDDRPVAAAAGHPVEAHRALVGRARELFTVRGPRSAVVVVADRPPVTSSLYQASKLLPPAGELLEAGGTVIVVAECDGGIGPLDRVNDGIYRLGVAPQLPADHRVVLVSALAPEVVAPTYAQAAPSLAEALDSALARHGVERAVLLWRAGESITRAL
jgi:nickel-dependent lactate racemase